MLKQGCVFEPGVIAKRFVVTATGQVGLLPREGITNIYNISGLKCFGPFYDDM